MNLADIKQLAADVKTLTAKSRASGPRTKIGKTRSALNATKHGLAGTHLLLPGEDRAEYERRMDAVFEALAPKDGAQAALVALVADDLWKLDRLGKIEQGVSLARIEELLGQTSSAGAAGELASAMTSLGQAIATWESDPLPLTTGEEFSRRLAVMSSAISFARIAVPDLGADAFDACEDQLAAVRGTKGDLSVLREAYAGLDQAARVLMAKLLEHGDKVESTQESLRNLIATVALPDEAELKKLGRYRKMLEEGLQRRLTALEHLRSLSSLAASTDDEKAAAREYRVRLRLVC
jgi:hypothetical protein